MSFSVGFSPRQMLSSEARRNNGLAGRLQPADALPQSPAPPSVDQQVVWKSPAQHRHRNEISRILPRAAKLSSLHRYPSSRYPPVPCRGPGNLRLAHKLSASPAFDVFSCCPQCSHGVPHGVHCQSHTKAIGTPQNTECGCVQSCHFSPADSVIPQQQILTEALTHLLPPRRTHRPLNLLE